MTGPIKAGTRTTVDCQTGEVLDVKEGAFTMLPVAPGKCPECAVEHAPDQPHNKDSLTYQFQFHARHGRSATWTDAMAHCPEDVRKRWRASLASFMKQSGLDVPPDLLEGGRHLMKGG